MPEPKTSEWNDTPTLECPECKKEWYQDDMGNPEAGDSYDCPECGEISKITLVEYSCHVSLEATGKKDSWFLESKKNPYTGYREPIK